MKRYFYRSFMLMSVVAAGVIANGCKDADYSKLTDRVYIAEAANSTSKSVMLEEEGATASITIRLDKPLGEEVRVKLSIDQSLIDTYNQINQTEIKPLPDEYLEDFDFDTPIVIPAGRVSADPTTIGIKSFVSSDRYALPLKIAQVNGPASSTDASSGYLLLIDKPLIVSSPKLSAASTTGDARVVCGPFEEGTTTPLGNWGLVVSGWTLEFWVKMDGWYQNSALFNSGGDGTENEIYIRFGDAGAPFNWLQIKTMGTQADTAKDFIENKWYHIALVYDGDQITIYRDGESVAAKATPGGTINIDRMEMISSGASWFRNNCNLSEIRYWKRALSITQIRNNRFYEINPQNPDLIAYWKMNEGSGSNFADATGNGHDAIALTGILKGWSHDQRFDR